MAPVNRTVSRDLGERSLRKILKEAHGSHVTVGIHEGAGEYPSTEEQPDPPLISEVGIINEFGSPTRGIPERSFIRSTVDENQRQLNEDIRVSYTNILLGKTNAKKELEKLGFAITTLIQNKIKTLKSPPNAPLTVELKGSNNPLVDSQLLMRSINFEVHIDG